MSLNWREIELILSETDLQGFMVQAVTQNSFHCLTWTLYRPGTGSLALLTEVGTPASRICLTDLSQAKKKTPKLQRFIQFARANIEGARIVSLKQTKGEREVVMTLTRAQKTILVFMRFFSGPGANIIVTDENLLIMDLLLRRPQRGEASGLVLKRTVPNENPKEFAIRQRTGGETFNEQINREYKEENTQDLLSLTRKRLENQRDKEEAFTLGTIMSLNKRIEANRDFEGLRHTADLISANIHLIYPLMTEVELFDYKTGKNVKVELDPKLKGSQHITYFYDKAKKAKGTYENALSELKQTEEKLAKLKAFYERALEQTDNPASDLIRMQNALKAAAHVADNTANAKIPGIVCTSGAHMIIIGRTAKENDDLLRHYVKGNDYWFHTRDCPGAYVFVKCPKNKTIPLEVMIDAANLASLYSKQKNASSVNLYYTHVKFLRRAKDGPLGLVLPTQEKNFTVKPDRKRAQALLGAKEFDYE